jgi:hypothetical protein
MKICPKCEIEKELSEYWKGTSYCKPCYNNWKKENRKKNKEKIAESRKKRWRETNSRYCKKCNSPFVGKGVKREYCSTSCKILGNIKIVQSCWEWQGDLHPNGYGYTTNYETNKREHVHRVSFKLFKGEIPEGLYICHHCDNRKCINPAHLFSGTAKENMQDAKRKGRLKNQYGRV